LCLVRHRRRPALRPASDGHQPEKTEASR
jgi:hypothetical protein